MLKFMLRETPMRRFSDGISLDGFVNKLKSNSHLLWRRLWKTKFPVTLLGFFTWTLFCSLFSAYALSMFITETKSDLQKRKEVYKSRFKSTSVINSTTITNFSLSNSLHSSKSIHFSHFKYNWDTSNETFSENVAQKSAIASQILNYSRDVEPHPVISTFETKSEDVIKPKYGLRPCNDTELSTLPPYQSQGYLLVICNGGLNQQRAAICNAVVLARALNLSLIVPHLQTHPVWGDDSNFEDIFNLDHFIQFLKRTVNIVNSVPAKVLARKSIEILNVPVDRNATLKWYQMNIPDAIQKQINRLQFKEMISNIPPLVIIDPFARRLANDLEKEWQQLRCRVNYHALVFNSEIKKISDLMIERMKKLSDKYVALHLRFEIDALAYSMCQYGGGERERKLFENYRHEHWASGMQNMREKLDPHHQKLKGQCPLTPKEAILFMKAMGIKNTSFVYVAALEDKLYESAKSLATLRRAYPNLITKKTLVSDDELTAFRGKASSLAALDYTLCVESEIYVPTSTGQFTNMVLGERIYRGHRKSYQPQLSLLAREFAKLNKTNWSQVKLKIRKGHALRMGKPKERAIFRSFFSNPMECLCKENNNETHALKGEF